MPIEVPRISNCIAKTRRRLTDGSCPAVAPETTIRAIGAADLSEWSKVAAPTVSITTSTRSGSRAPGSTAVAPRAEIRSRLAASRLVAYTRLPIATASATAAVATPPPAPWTSTLSASAMRPLVVSIRHAVSQAVGRHAASVAAMPSGSGIRFDRGTATRSASVPEKCSERMETPRGSPGVTTTGYTTTGRPSGSNPTASQPRIIGS